MSTYRRAAVVPIRRKASVVEMPLRELGRRGVFFQEAGQHLRSCWVNFDGKVVLGDECSCDYSYHPDEVWRSGNCVIDQHRIEALREEE